MATDYSKKTNAELVEILKSRSLPHTGKKAEMVARLQEDDNKAQAAPAPASAPKTDTADDVIDWEDDDVAAAEPAKPSTEAGAAAIAAGGQGAVANPVAVTNQKLDTNPATTDDLKVESKGAAPSAESGAQGHEGTEAAPAEPATTTEAEAKPAPDYSMGLPVTELEEELRKRKARAEKFGITEDSKAAIADAEKQLERAKRFGTGVQETTGSGVKGLDEALPTEKPRKRGRTDNEQATRGGKRRDVGGRNRFRGRDRGNRNQNQNQRGEGNGPKNNQQSGLSEKDRLAMEARKKRFATAA
ncbi:SAP domain-containing protein [Aspergillus clavatus NRRL 1]|uniref:SAP domain protein, putative n=1 Tax=Aspergillus clavatus (strain ATCC 1007 / CBS 513.65 / DSM 816 / NCTC 3887 / NRRL 1 / QM 1276 / 107) TaxID=344612 RepID=A1C7H5_ASPCL|nr:SAP domain protein, putative [Aspergillus clavatus NRRL 1]EAW14346.1 SAP domain protein, putative [Aspergillus clavatus NRRL 1]